MHAGDIPDYLVEPSNFPIPYFLGNKLPQTEWLKKTDIQYLPVLEVRSLKSRGWQGYVPSWENLFPFLFRLQRPPGPPGFLGLWSLSLIVKPLAFIVTFLSAHSDLLQFSSVQFSHSAVSDSLWPQEPQHNESQPLFPLFPLQSAMKWWDQMHDLSFLNVEL